MELLQERVTLFSDLVEATARGEAEKEGGVQVRTSCSRNLFRADTPCAAKAEPLLLAAICQGEKAFQVSVATSPQTAEPVSLSQSTG